MLLNIDQLEESEKRFSAIEPGPVREKAAILSEEASIPDVSPEITAGNIIGEKENMRKRISMLADTAKEPLEFALERAIGRNDSVYSNFVELIANAKKKVGRIACRVGGKHVGSATGFMVSDRLLLTNWHVFKTIDKAVESEIQFFYEYDIYGSPSREHVCFKLRPDIFYHSDKALDYCFVGVNANDITGKVSLRDIGYIYLDPGLGKLGNEEEEALNIIHHPDGDFKQLSIRENLFKKITATSIWYESDTAPGSSGSPVFNDQWQVVALHHMGVAKKNDAGQYVDKNDRVIEEVDGKIDESKVVWIANEGIRISVILKDLFAKFPGDNNVSSIKLKPGDSPVYPKVDDWKKPHDNSPHTPSMESGNTNNNQVNISFPPSLLEATGAVTIRIDKHGRTEKPVSHAEAGDSELDLLEIKKLEQNMDWSGCKGYRSDFLGHSIPLPKPKSSLKKFIAKMDGTGNMVLNYHHYSVMQHTVRMMPVISAINVDGNLKKRLDDSERKDVWLRDNRIDFDVQLDDTYYKKSGFDRGHMSRREDANWGNTAENAKRNADLTCMHTNACPQVGALNRSNKDGLWGILEKVILEEGATQEKARTRKISVFNGPVFKNTDPVYKGIQVPMTFYKIVLWLTDNGDLKATAFKLDQKDLVGDIDFEQLDLDQNLQFKEFQCSIKSLERETGLDFSGIVDFDTFDGANTDEMALVTEESVRSHVDRVNKGATRRGKTSSGPKTKE